MSFPRYPSYKDSGVEWLGQVPEHWEVKPLYGCADERYESNKGMIDDNLLSLSYGRIVVKDMASNDGLLPESFETYQIIRRGDIVFRLTDLQNDKRSLRSALVEEDGIITSAYLAVTPREADSRYMAYLFRAYDRTKVFYSMGGGLRQSMKYSDVKRLPTVLAPLVEQIAIAEFLDRETGKIDELVAEQGRLMGLLKEKRQAVISHAVTRGLNPTAPLKPSGIEWLGDVPAHWEIGKLSRLISTRKGIAFKAEDFTDEGVPVVKASDIKGLTIRRSETCLPESFQYPKARLKTGELILSTVGSTPEVRNSAVGQLGMVPETLSESLLNQNTVVFTPSSMTLMNDFLFLILQTVGYRDHLDLHAHGTANQASINVSDMLDFFVPLPNLAEQEQIVRLISEELAKFNILTAEAQRAIDLLQERRTALISAAVTGQIDVRKEAT